MDKKKIVINRSFGTFSLSHKAFQRLRELGQPEAIREPDRGAYWPSGVRPDDPDFNRCGLDIPRDDLKLVQVVEELSIQANGHGAELRIVEIPGEVAWEVESVGGREHVSEAHRRWS
jgi:hypothetical protein